MAKAVCIGDDGSFYEFEGGFPNLPSRSFSGVQFIFNSEGMLVIVCEFHKSIICGRMAMHNPYGKLMQDTFVTSKDTRIWFEGEQLDDFES